MRKSLGRQQMFSRRALIFSGASVAALSVLAGRLYYLQFIRQEDFTTLAEGNRIKLQLVIPPRGTLLDRVGLPLARNEKNYRVLVEPAKKQEVTATLEKLSRFIALDATEIERLVKLVPSSVSAPATLIKEHLEWEELASVEFHAPDLPGVVVDSGQSRHYRLSEKAAHLIGYVGSVSQDDLDADQPLLRLPDFKIGKSGAEKLLEKEVRGSAGIRQIEVNVHGQPVRELSTKPSAPGKNLRLTVDSRLQAYAAERLGTESGSVVVMDVKNGDLLALVSMPAFDPNIFSKGILHDYWKELNANTRSPLMNKAISGQYPPGSTFKMITGLAGLEAETITAQSRVFCPGFFMLGNHRFNCWKEEGHGSVNLHDALMGSCDTFFYTVSQRVGMDAIADMARRFGLGGATGLNISGERVGVVPDRSWKMKRYKQPWQMGDTVNCAIGQGYALSTPMQLAVMTARIANGGLAVLPRLVLPEDETLPASFPLMRIDPEHLLTVQEGMNAAVNNQGGTAYGKRIVEPEFAMAGKTGTSQVRRITVRGRDQSTIPWEERHHAWFVGYAPVSNPAYAVSVLVEHGGGGASAAAPIARDVLLRAQQLLGEPVSESERAQAYKL